MPMIESGVPLRAMFDLPRFLNLPTYTVVTNGMAGYIFVKDSHWSKLVEASRRYLLRAYTWYNIDTPPRHRAPYPVKRNFSLDVVIRRLRISFNLELQPYPQLARLSSDRSFCDLLVLDTNPTTFSLFLPDNRPRDPHNQPYSNPGFSVPEASKKEITSCVTDRVLEFPPPMPGPLCPALAALVLVLMNSGAPILS